MVGKSLTIPFVKVSRQPDPGVGNLKGEPRTASRRQAEWNVIREPKSLDFTKNAVCTVQLDTASIFIILL